MGKEKKVLLFLRSKGYMNQAQYEYLFIVVDLLEQYAELCQSENIAELSSYRSLLDDAVKKVQELEAEIKKLERQLRY